MPAILSSVDILASSATDGFAPLVDAILGRWKTEVFEYETPC